MGGVMQGPFCDVCYDPAPLREGSFWFCRKHSSVGRAERLKKVQEYGQANSPRSVSPREVLLDEAKRLICSDRNNQYGPPTADFARTAAIWSVLFDREFTAHEVAMAMIALKLSRLTWDPTKLDSWLDCAGYSACGWEAVDADE